MARKVTPSFVLELPPRTAAGDERALAIRLNAARNIDNACRGEGLRRLELMRQSKAWQAARKLPRGQPGSEERKGRAQAFKAIYVAYGFTRAHIQRFAQRCRDACWIRDHRGGRDTQTTSLRAFRAVEQYAFGRPGRPRGAGLFVGMLARKAAFGTRSTCLSQFDHVDGTLIRKQLSQRYHAFSDGTLVGPDLYSAFLARFVHGDRLDASQARVAWPGREALLRTASSDGFQPASGRGFAPPHVTLGVRAGRSRNPGQNREAEDVYPLAPTPTERASESGALLEIPDGT